MERMADIAGHQEWRALGQSDGVIDRLTERLLHVLVVCPGSPYWAGPALVLGASLFCLQDEAAGLEQINGARGCAAVQVGDLQVFLEAVIRMLVLGARHADLQGLAEIQHEGIFVGPLVSGRPPPFLDERADAVTHKRMLHGFHGQRSFI